MMATVPMASKSSACGMRPVSTRKTRGESAFARAFVRAFAAAIALTLLLTGLSDGAVRTWTGGGADDNWSTGGNWGGTAPAPGDELHFAGSTRLNPVNDISGGTSFYSITFDAGAGPFVVQHLPWSLASSAHRAGHELAEGP